MMGPMTISPEPPAPVRPVMYMGWYDLAYLHWRLHPDALRSVLPDGLEPDVFDGSAWVGLIPFSMERIRFPGLPVLPYVSRFPETNVRTYVRGPDGGDGIWFFSLDVDRLLPALVARAAYRLPYCWGPMGIERRGSTVAYWGRRRWPGPAGARSRIVVDVGERILPGAVDDLTHFLTARWALYSTFRGGLLRAPVAHPRWPLREARVVTVEQDLVEAAGLPSPEGPPLVHWSPGVEVRVGVPRRVA
jgi:uncharacterized protein YqjF (DUF2071 family)